MSPVRAMASAETSRRKKQKNMMKTLKIIVTLVLFATGSVQAGTVTFDPNPTTVVLGSIFTLDIVGTGFPGTEGGGAQFTYDASVLQVNSVTIDSNVWEFFADTGSIDNITGSVDGIAVATFVDPGASFAVASIEFVAIGIGATSLLLSENPLNPWASAGSPVNPAMTAGSVAVTPVPVPAAVWMFGSALGLLGWMRLGRTGGIAG